MYDIVIVGGGPAGATLARMVGRTHRTLLLERRPVRSCELGPQRAKCCGGLLAPDAQRALAALGLGVPREVLAGPQLFAVRAVDAPSGLVRHYQRHYLNVDRGRFDEWLRSLLPPEVEVRRGARVTALRDEGEAVAVETEVTGGRTVVRGRLVVGADGAGSLVRRLGFPGSAAPSSYVAIQEWFEAVHLDPCYTVLFDPGLTDFYAWAIPKAGRLVVGAALPPGPGAPARFDRLVERFRGVGLRMGRSLGREGTLLSRPTRPSQLLTGGGRVALVGEAAGLISPSSAEGVSFALRSAALLAEALTPALEGWADRYRTATRSLRRGLLLKDAQGSGALHAGSAPAGDGERGRRHGGGAAAAARRAGGVALPVTPSPDRAGPSSVGAPARRLDLDELGAVRSGSAAITLGAGARR